MLLVQTVHMNFSLYRMVMLVKEYYVDYYNFMYVSKLQTKKPIRSLLYFDIFQPEDHAYFGTQFLPSFFL